MRASFGNALPPSCLRLAFPFVGPMRSRKFHSVPRKGETVLPKHLQNQWEDRAVLSSAGVARESRADLPQGRRLADTVYQISMCDAFCHMLQCVFQGSCPQSERGAPAISASRLASFENDPDQGRGWKSWLRSVAPALISAPHPARGRSRALMARSGGQVTFASDLAFDRGGPTGALGHHGAT